MKKVITFCILMLFTANAYASITINFDDVSGSETDITNRYTGLGVTLNAIENSYLVSTHPLVARSGPYPAPATLPTILGGVTTGGKGFPCAPSPPQVAVSARTNTINAGNRGILISFAFDVTSVSLVGNDMGITSRDDESVTLTAYNALGNRIGQVYSTVNLYSEEGYDLTPAAISLPEIRYVAFNYTGTYHGFYAIDDLEFDPAVIPTPPVETGIDIAPDTLNLKSKGKWITCYIESVEGYGVGDIDVSTILLEALLEAQRSDIRDEVLMVKFDRPALIEYLGVTTGDVTLTITGELRDGTPFEGTDTITVIDKGGKN